METERLILRPYQLSDAASLYELAKDPEIGPRCGWMPHTSMENSLDIIQSILSVDGTYAIVQKETNQLIGTISLMDSSQSNLQLKEDERELGYWIGRDYWRQGYAYEAAFYLLQHSSYHCIWVMCSLNNEASFSLQQKLGFQFIEQRGMKKISKLEKEEVTFYVVRHGKTLFNEKKRVQGVVDSPLSELGIAQAKALGNAWDISNIEIAYSSTSERAVDTMHYIVQNRIPCFEHKGFKEINFGSNEGQRIKDVFPNGTVHIRSYEPYGGEDKEKAAKRFMDTMKEVAQLSGKKNIMIVAHGSIIREILCEMSDYYKFNEMSTFKMVPNCSVTTFVLKDNQITLKEGPKLIL